MSFGDIGRRPDSGFGSLSDKSSITPQQISQQIVALQKKCSALNERILVLRRKKVVQQEKLDLEKDIASLKHEAGMTGAQIEAQRLRVEKAAANGDASAQRAVFNKLVKDFDLIKANIDVVVKQSALVKVTATDEFAKDSFSRVQPTSPTESHATSSGSTTSTTPDNSVLMVKQQQIQMQVVDVDELLILERERDIKKLHHDLALVKDMYQDMANIVERQGEHIDVIHEAADQSHEQAKAGLEQVKQASNYQPGCSIC